MTQNNLIGVWKLVSAEFQHSDGTVTFPWGNPPAGQIIYSAAGQMAAQIMKLGRRSFAAKDHMRGTEAEIREAFEGYQAYYGTYTISEKDKVIDHLVTGSVFPNLVGRTLKRYYEFYNSRLILRTPPMKMGGTEVTIVLVWERL